MGGLNAIQEGVINFVKDNPVATGLGVAGAGAATVLGTAAVVSAVRKKTKKSKARKASNRGRKRVKLRGSHRKKRNSKYARTAGKKRDRSHKRIRMTKKGQPYIILKSGKARFISKSSARRSKKRKGGRY